MALRRPPVLLVAAPSRPDRTVPALLWLHDPRGRRPSPAAPEGVVTAVAVSLGAGLTVIGVCLLLGASVFAWSFAAGLMVGLLLLALGWMP